MKIPHQILCILNEWLPQFFQWNRVVPYYRATLYVSRYQYNQFKCSKQSKKKTVAKSITKISDETAALGSHNRIIVKMMMDQAFQEISAVIFLFHLRLAWQQVQ